jgi:N-carbamoyl-L-amino-acid hydrolase
VSGLELAVDIDRLMAELGELAAHSDAPAPAVTRVVYSSSDLAARALVKKLFLEAGLSIREDAIGNTFARWEGTRRELHAVATGSHIDAIPHSGRFDGTVGVLGAIEAIRALRAAGFRPIRPIEVVLFTSEEPTRFGIGCLGSRGMCGSLSDRALASLVDHDGNTLDVLRIAAGFAGALSEVRVAENRFAAFVELHIEQGPLLERAGTAIGIVTAIAAPAALRVTWEGEGGHAGAVLMGGRRDALCAAAEAVLAVEHSAHSSGGPDTVATTGICRVHPGAINSIPERVTLEIDVRDIDPEPRDRVIASIGRAAAEIAARRGVSAIVECLSSDPPARSSPLVVEAIQSACHEAGVSSMLMVSRAYHDTLFMARLAPAGMIFIPCKGGISHRPDESIEAPDLARGVMVLALTLARLSTAVDHAAATAHVPRESVPVMDP